MVVLLNRFNKILVSILLTATIGLHWPVLQSIAWLNMLVSYSRQDSFDVALSKTFDGKHPCKICNIVQKGKETESRDSKFKSRDKVDWAIISSAPFFLSNPPLPLEPFRSPNAVLRFYPPIPPPPDLA